MALDVLGLNLANSYTDETVEGGGAIKGKNCTVDDISKSGKKNTVRFKWTLDDGTVLTGNMEVLDGEDGAPGTPGANGKDGKDGADGDPGPAGKGIASIEQVTGESQILITYDDGTEADPIDIPTVAGQDGKDGEDGTDGVSPSVVVKTSTGESYILTITDASGSYDTPNLKGADGQDGQDGTDGVGVPSGGTTGQVLKKKSGTDYDTEWGDVGSGGTSDYTDLTNKPQINSVTLSGNKSLSDLGIIGTSLTAGLVKNDGTIDTTQYLSQHQDISGKADKVSGATNGNFAGLDSNGNLTDSGNKASDFLTSHQDISGKADKVTSATENDFAGLDSNGNLKDSGKKASDFATSAQAVPSGGTTGQVLKKKSGTDYDTEWGDAGGGSGEHIQYDTMPTAEQSIEGKIVQYTGTTNSLYTNGYFYTCEYDDSGYTIATPVMTSNTTPSGICSSSTKYGSREPYYMFKQNTDPNTDIDEQWSTDFNGALDVWVQYKFDTAKIITKVDTYNRTDGQYAAKNMTLKGSNDGTNWTNIDSFINTTEVGAARSQFKIDNQNAYTYYRLQIDSFYHSGRAVSFLCVNLFTGNDGYVWNRSDVQPKNNYSTTEHVVGTWIDGKPVYEKTYVIQSAVTLAINTYTTVINDPPENVDTLIDIALSSSIRSFVYWNSASIGQFTATASGLNTLSAGTSFTYRYTKTTD